MIGSEYQLDTFQILFGVISKNSYDINLLILKGKYFIAKQTFLKKRIIFNSFINTVKYDLDVEKYICERNHGMNEFNTKYSKLHNILCNA